MLKKRDGERKPQRDISYTSTENGLNNTSEGWSNTDSNLDYDEQRLSPKGFHLRS